MREAGVYQQWLSGVCQTSKSCLAVSAINCSLPRVAPAGVPGIPSCRLWRRLRPATRQGYYKSKGKSVCICIYLYVCVCIFVYVCQCGYLYRYLSDVIFCCFLFRWIGAEGLPGSCRPGEAAAPPETRTRFSIQFWRLKSAACLTCGPKGRIPMYILNLWPSSYGASFSSCCFWGVLKGFCE